MEIRELEGDAVERLYNDCLRRDFPPAELRPLTSIRALERKGLYRTLACFDGDKQAAYATFVSSEKEPRALLLDYYAVEPAKRGQGVGSRFLAALQKTLSEQAAAPYLLLEAESLPSAQTPAQVEERTRRFRFYAGCGCKETNVYARVFGVEYRILVLPLKEDAPQDETVQSAMMGLYHTFIPPLVGKDEAAFDRVCKCFLRR